LPGSLTATAQLVRDEGRDVLVIPSDLLDASTLGAAATVTLERWGRVDVVVHNARYIGPGNFDQFLDTPVSILEQTMFANVFAPLILNKYFLPGMIDRGSGTIVNITSGSAYGDPLAAAGAGGWGLSYGLSKGAFHRVAGILATELGDKGIHCFNVQPNQIATERLAADSGIYGIESGGAPPEVVAAVVKWLVSSPEARQFNGKNVEAQFFCHERGLLPGWEGPTVNHAPIRYDMSGRDLLELENRLRERNGVRAIQG
jgi:NAD(P)-dependent dehydrogenase (short-subunit alcohol dehydrogenase family)